MKIYQVQRLFIAVFILVLVGTLGLSCKSSGTVPTLTNTFEKGSDRQEVIHDTVFRTEKDSAAIKALIECQNGKPVFKNGKPANDPKKPGATKPRLPESKQGRKTSADMTLHPDGTIECDCQAEAEELHAKWKSVFIKEWEKSHVQEPIKVNELTDWQVCQIYAGRVFLFLLLLAVVYSVWKFFK